MIARIATGTKMRNSLGMAFDFIESHQRSVHFMKHVGWELGNARTGEPSALGHAPPMPLWRLLGAMPP